MKKIMFSIILVLTFLFGLTYVYAEENNTVDNGNESFPNIIEGGSTNNNGSLLASDIPEGPKIEEADLNNEDSNLTVPQQGEDTTNETATINDIGDTNTTTVDDTNVTTEPSGNNETPTEPTRGETTEPTRAGEGNETTEETPETHFVKYTYSNGKYLVSKGGATVTLSQLLEKFEIAETLQTVTSVTASDPKITVTHLSSGEYNLVSAVYY